MEAPTRFELVNKGFADLCLTTWLWRHNIKMERVTRLELATSTLARWRSTRWAKPAYFIYNVVPPVGIEPTTRGFSVPCSTDWATEAHIWRPEWGSNPRPLAWQASVLTNWTTGPNVWWEQQGSNLWPSACKADALPAELCSHINLFSEIAGAGYEARTRYLHLGKVALYQMS